MNLKEILKIVTFIPTAEYFQFIGLREIYRFSSRQRLIGVDDFVLD